MLSRRRLPIFGLGLLNLVREFDEVNLSSISLRCAMELQDVLSVPFVGNHGTQFLMSSFNHSHLNTSYYSLETTLNDQAANPF